MQIKGYFHTGLWIVVHESMPETNCARLEKAWVCKQYDTERFAARLFEFTVPLHRAAHSVTAPGKQ